MAATIKQKRTKLDQVSHYNNGCYTTKTACYKDKSLFSLPQDKVYPENLNESLKGWFRSF